MTRALFGLLVVVLVGCGGAAPTAKTAATDAINVTETAWLLAATACQASPTPAIKVQCANVLLPARSALLAAALDVDQGGTNYACELGQVASALTFVSGLGVTLPQGVKDAQALLQTIPCVSPPAADAGSSLGVVVTTADASAALVKTATPTPPPVSLPLPSDAGAQ